MTAHTRLAGWLLLLALAGLLLPANVADRFKKGELDSVRLGVTAKNIRFAITNIKIKGTVDPSKL